MKIANATPPNANKLAMIASSPNIPVTRRRPRYYTVDSFTLVTASGRVNFDLNAGLNDVATDARSAGQRAYIHHFVVRIGLEYKDVAGEAGNFSILFTNLLAAMSIKTKVPLLTSYLWSNETRLHHAELDGLSVNRYAVAIQRQLQAGTSRYPVNYGNDDFAQHGAVSNGFGTGSILINGKPDEVTNDTWNCSSRFMNICTNAGVANGFTREYSMVIPATIKSGAPVHPLYVDRLPMEIFTSSAQKAQFNIGFANSLTLSDVLRAGATPCGALKMTISLDAYVVFDLATDPFAHGVTWQSDPFAINATGQTPGADFYRQIAVYPPSYDTAQTDGLATGLFFNPYDFSTINWDSDSSRVQWQVNGVNIWPSTERNFARELVADYNSSEDLMVSPGLYYERGLGNTFTSGAGTTGGGTVVNPNYVSVLGKMTHMPILPLAFSNPAQVGFAPGFFGTPGDANTSLQVSLLQWSLTPDMINSTRAIVMAGTTNWRNQRDNIRMFETYGSNARGNASAAWRPFIDNPNSSRAALFEPLMAETAPSGL